MAGPNASEEVLLKSAPPCLPQAAELKRQGTTAYAQQASGEKVCLFLKDWAAAAELYSEALKSGALKG